MAKDLCQKFNSCEAKQMEEKKKILERLFQKEIDIIGIEPNFYCDYGFNIHLGKNFYSNHNLVILDANKVEFGDNVVIGAGSVVNKDIPSNCVAVGNPCKVIKKMQ